MIKSVAGFWAGFWDYMTYRQGQHECAVAYRRGSTVAYYLAGGW